MVREQFSLCGEWKFSANGGPTEIRIVPSSSFVIGNRQLFSDFFDCFIAASRNTEKGKTLAGISYWQWNDIYLLSRDLGCADGILTEGLVDVKRNIKPDSYDTRYEIYHLNLLRVDLPHPGKVKSVTVKSLDDKSTLLLYGITCQCG